MNLLPIISFALRHHGVVCLDRATELGITRREWYWALESGRIEQLHPKVARLPGSPDTPEQRIQAAVMACGSDAMGSHRSAVHLWVPSAAPPDFVDVIVERRNGIELVGVHVHRPTDRADLRPVYRRNIAVTNPLRALADLGAVDPAGVRPALERMVIAGFVTPGAVLASLERHRARGRDGVTALDRALRDWTMNVKPPDSVLEEAMNSLALRFSLPPIKFHEVIEGYEVDFHVLGSPVVIECDGWATHGLLRETFERDRIRDADLLAAGYVVVRFTWRQIKRHPAAVARRLRSVLARFGTPVPSPFSLS